MPGRTSTRGEADLVARSKVPLRANYYHQHRENTPHLIDVCVAELLPSYLRVVFRYMSLKAAVRASGLILVPP
jgi:hypothetical protein